MSLDQTLKKIKECGAKFKISKCAIMRPKVEYFAFVLDRECIHPSPAKVQNFFSQKKKPSYNHF